MAKSLLNFTSLLTATTAVVGNLLADPRIEQSGLLKAAALLHACRLVLKKGYSKYVAILLILVTVPKFRLGLGRPDADEVSILSHVFRFLAFWRTDLKLPPILPITLLAKTAHDHGLWQRHLSESLWASKLGSCFRFYFPLNNLNPAKIATMCAFFTQPQDVEEILTQKDVFPSRGRTGFTDLLGEGLLGMESGKKWASHRHLVSKFLSQNHLKEFSTVIAEETLVLLNKWESGAHKGTPLDVQYDLSMCTLDVIMRVAFGIPDEFLSQRIRAEDNHMAHGLDTALKAIIIQTALPYSEHLPTPLNWACRNAIKDLKDLSRTVFDLGKKNFEKNGAPEKATILSEFLRIRNEGGADLSDSEIIDELTTIRGAGHET